MTTKTDGVSPAFTDGTKKLPPARSSRTNGDCPRAMALTILMLYMATCLLGCRENSPVSAGNFGDARELLTQAMTAFDAGSAKEKGAERERLLNEAAARYDELLKRFPTETNFCAQSLRALGNIHATQGRTNEAVKLYATVGEKYASQDWEVLQAWKAAADLLWDVNRRDEAKKFYARIVERFGKNDAPQIFQQVVRGSKARLGE